MLEQFGQDVILKTCSGCTIPQSMQALSEDVLVFLLTDLLLPDINCGATNTFWVCFYVVFGVALHCFDGAVTVVFRILVFSNFDF